MKESFYLQPKPYRIYLLLLDEEEGEEPFYFVGKTANTLAKVYSKHINGGFSTTKPVFSTDARPKLYVLQDRLLTESDAYRYVVAYIKWFEARGLGECLNYDGTTWQAESMKPETEKIYQEISKEPLEEMLRRTYVMRAIEADRKREKIAGQEEKRTVQFNVGVSEDKKAAFDAYCKKLGVSRREAFGMLLDVAINKTGVHYESIISSKEKKIERLEQGIKKLEQKLALATGEVLPKKELWASAMVPFMLDGVKQYLKLLFPQKEVIQPVESRPYKGFARNLLPDEEYAYPGKEGFYLIRLAAVLWGKNKSCFYIGVGADGKNYKFRYYSKEWFLGIPPRGSGYEEQNSCWLVGCKKAADGAMDLIAALPLPGGITSNHNGMDQDWDKPVQPPKPSLTDRITGAEKRKHP